jgi:lipopolysaccharide/colanic/teichoic acid biosynthesis glycosyltransferase
LYSCGFEIVEEQFINNRLFFVFRKIKEPLFDYHPTYGPIVKLQRIGKNGQIIGVFKMRTMHAYSEYLQDYIYNKYNLDEGGKFRNDFRITTLGRIFRAFWLDEFPMLINVFILRNLKIVGVRPLSLHYFSLYSAELKQRRIKCKPGLIPPYYAQYPTPKTLDEIQRNEIEYLEQYEKHPFFTDLRYFFKAMNNIIFRKARSA